ncbi:NEAT domain-containing protein [Streptococcus loxodontisalivarius]|uniref:Heme-binding NEAT domain protein n=1 Tax=Streptococcus loxodontisalivarius TaxID=1349415 RepID=A0ABS2PSA4_9STRE|nr:NEAT domain-containing protein [Streptococcus loxodontisalivarius]MBM7642917.1 heme-binding NEAT domain protein [Streptococcus loxodontisalivarius]
MKKQHWIRLAAVSTLAFAAYAPQVLAPTNSGNIVYATETSRSATVTAYQASAPSLTSMMNNYISTSNQEIVTVNGQKYVQFTITNASWWQSFSVNGVPVTTVAEDTAANTRTVRFAYVEGQTDYTAHIHITVAAMNYDANHDAILRVVAEPEKTGDLVVNYVDQNGNVLQSQTLYDDALVGTSYQSTAPASLSLAGKQYDLQGLVSGSASGSIAEGTTTIVYRYVEHVETTTTTTTEATTTSTTTTTEPTTTQTSSKIEKAYFLNQKDQTKYSSMQDYITGTAEISGDKATLTFTKTTGITSFKVDGVEVPIVDGKATFTYKEGQSDYNTSFDVQMGNYKASHQVPLHIGKLETEPTKVSRPAATTTTTTETSLETEATTSSTTSATTEATTSTTEAVSSKTEKVYLLNQKDQTKYSSMQDYIDGTVEISGDKATLTFTKTTGITSFSVNGVIVPIIDGKASFTYDPSVSDYTTVFNVAMGTYKNAYTVPMHIGQLETEPTKVSRPVPTTTTTETSQATEATTSSTTVATTKQTTTEATTSSSATTKATTSQTTTAKTSQVTTEPSQGNASITIYKNGTSEQSAMQKFVSSSAKIVTVDGKQYVEMTFTSNASMVKGFSVDGQAVTVVSDSGNTRVVRFAYTGSKVYQGAIHVAVPGLYEETYNVQIQVSSSVKAVQQTAAQPNPSTSGSSSASSAQSAATNQATDILPSLSADEQAARITVFKNGTSETSVMQNYVNSNGKIVTVDGQKYVELTFKANAYMVEGFWIEGQAASVVSDNGSVRVVRFPYTEGKTTYNASIHVNVPGVYNETYAVQIKVEPGQVGSDSSASTTSTSTGTGLKRGSLPSTGETEGQSFLASLAGLGLIGLILTTISRGKKSKED